MIKTIEGITKRFNIDSNGCWNWKGTIDTTGYAVLNINGKRQYAHRIMYQLMVGPIYSNWLQIDHLCRNRKCVNPAHLELVTSRENSLRGNHPLFTLHREKKCKRGHDLSIEENRLYRKDGRYRCKICRKEYQHNSRIRNLNDN